ncbi:MAG: hypothetical protein JNM27_19030 [Leptospirales bacterium]|nr:hypothetical protein [Leptospirales bacterium]
MRSKRRARDLLRTGVFASTGLLALHCQSTPIELTEAERKIIVVNAPAAHFLELNCAATGGVIEAGSIPSAAKIAAMRGATHLQQFQIEQGSYSNFNVPHTSSSYAYRAWRCPLPTRVCGGIAAIRCEQNEECKMEAKHPDATGFCVAKP